MYLEEIYLENTGPISKCHAKPLFADNGNPLPVVIVGPNGSGKSIFLSYIVDALTEFAKKVFRDIVPTDGLGTPFFRVIHPRAIRSGKPFSLSLLHFKANDEDLYYCEKSGLLNPTDYSPSVKSVFAPVWGWAKDENHKNVSVNEKTIETEMQNGSYAFFPARRHEEPDWLNPKSLKAEPNPFSSRFDRQLDKPLWIETCAEENIPWILDVFLDSLIDPDILQRLQILQVAGSRSVISHNLNQVESAELRDRQILRQARQNVERILQAILQDGTAKLYLNYRNIGPSRISIKMKNGRTIPTLQSLSEGQSQLFHLFATIIRYGERSDINMSIRLSDITGLVVIDEIDAHLHPTLQYSVVPKLIKLFPKVQFIVSSHSPLFLLGMESTFGPDKVTIFKLPDGDRISSEEYPEFRSAFEYYQATNHFENEVEKRFARGTKPLLLTEGSLDPRYIQTALTQLGHQELLNSFDIEFVGMEDEKGTRYGGDKGLNHFRNIYEANSSLFHRPILLLYDCDTQKPDEQVGRLWVRSIPHNAENTKVKIGIENLFPADLFQDCFYPEVPTKDGGYTKHLDKNKFCDWICENQNAADFPNFGVIVDILKEFVDAHQPPSGQSLTSE